MEKKYRNDKKYILRVAVEGNTRDELADNLISLAELFRNHKVLALGQDNCMGGESSEKWGYFDFDYDCSEKQDDKNVSIMLPEIRLKDWSTEPRKVQQMLIGIFVCLALLLCIFIGFVLVILSGEK